jgi:Phage capsid family
MELVAELKAALAERDDAIAGRLGSIEKLLKEHGEKWSALEDLQARASSPGRTAGETAATREHKKRFEAWLRRPRDSHTKQELENFERAEFKAVQISAGADGGFGVPEEIAQQIERLEFKLSPVRNLVKILRVGTSDFKHLLNIRGVTSGWVGENTARPETATSQLREIAPTMGELYAYPQTTEWALDDIFFDVSQWLAESAAESFALNEGDSVIRGNGVNKPTGMLNTAPTSADDAFPPTRCGRVSVLPQRHAGDVRGGRSVRCALQGERDLQSQRRVGDELRHGKAHSRLQGQSEPIFVGADACRWSTGLTARLPGRDLGADGQRRGERAPGCVRRLQPRLSAGRPRRVAHHGGREHHPAGQDQVLHPPA